MMFYLKCFLKFFIEIKFTSHETNHFTGYNSVASSTFTISCNHYFCQVPQHFFLPKGKPQTHWAAAPHSPSTSPWQPPICFLSLWICLSGTFHINGVIQYVELCLAYSCRFVPCVFHWMIYGEYVNMVGLCPLFKSFCGVPRYEWMCHYLFIQPPLVGHPGRLLQWHPNLDLQNWASHQRSHNWPFPNLLPEEAAAEWRCEFTDASETTSPQKRK